MMDNQIALTENIKQITDSDAPKLLLKIRPQWQSKNLIQRVKNLIAVDPSSACQRLLNASIHDLREKISIAGIDIAAEACKQYKLPPVTKSEDLENYSATNLINLSYRMGLLSRPEWRRVCRCYEIRRDLEHEDDEYEAGVEDCIYIFKTCIDVILSRDPIQLIKVTDFKELIEEASAIVPDRAFLEDFENAPQPRQEEILKFLISKALDSNISDVIQQNAYSCIGYLNPITRSAVSVKIGEYLQQRVGRNHLTPRMARIAEAVGVFPYLRRSVRIDFFEKVYSELSDIGTHWQQNEKHGDLLRSFIEYGGMNNCPLEVRKKILKWLILTFIGSPGGQTRYGNVRHVFYSNSAAPLIEEIILKSAITIKNDLKNLRRAKEIKTALQNNHVARRFEKLIDLVDIDISEQ